MLPIFYKIHVLNRKKIVVDDKYLNVVYKYGKVAFAKDERPDGTLPMKFDYDIINNPDKYNITLTNYNTLFYKAFKLSYYEINKEELDREKKGNIKTIINEIYNVTLKNYLDKLEDISEWADHGIIIDFMKLYKDVNIFFIDANTKLPYQMGDCSMYDKNKDSIIIYYHPPKHFEIIGI